MLSGAHLEGYTLIRKGFVRLAEAQSELSLTETAVRVQTHSCRSAHHTHTHTQHTSKRLQVNRAGGDSAIGSAVLCARLFWSGTGFVWDRDLLQTSKHVCVGLIHDDACVSTNTNKMIRPPSRWRNIGKTGCTGFFFCFYS